MLPSLKDFSICSSGFIRKLDKRSHWHPEEGDNDPQKRASLITAKIFTDPANTYSLWFVNNEHDFYGVVASLIANATPQDRNIDFLWIDQQELDEAGIIPEVVPEGDCLLVKDLHHNAEITKTQAQTLCQILIQNCRDSQRCPKKKTIAIIDLQKSKGCHALVQNSPKCQC